MSDVDVVAVVGACAPERLRFAKRLATMTQSSFIRATQLAGSPDPVHEAAVLASWTMGAVVELPDEALATELIGAFAEPDSRVNLRALVCVVDASHLLEDLYREEYIPVRDAESGIHAPFLARADLAVRQIEFASVIVLVNWSGMDTVALSTVMALVSSLSPRARLRLQRAGFTPLEASDVYTESQDRAGWMSVLNHDHRPHMVDRRVSAFHYEEPRPFHPGRLRVLLDRIDAGDFGKVVRSAGFFRLATRPNVVAQWEHVGRMITFTPLAMDERLDPDEDILAVGQDLAFFGIDVDVECLRAALGAATLTNDELTAGPRAWSRFADPFPVWTTVSERSE